jgi:hypothetical protein
MYSVLMRLKDEKKDNLLDLHVMLLSNLTRCDAGPCDLLSTVKVLICIFHVLYRVFGERKCRVSSEAFQRRSTQRAKELSQSTSSVPLMVSKTFRMCGA